MTLNKDPEHKVHEPDQSFSMYSTDDLAVLFNCSTRHIRRLVFREDFPRPLKVGRLSRWSKPAVERWLTKKVGLANMKGGLSK
jgi:predicted DNA-binding transcriptional regulator AlpA